MSADKTVLIVDDDPLALQLLTAILKSCGVDSVLTAPDGEAALSVLEQAAPDPVLIISDIDMPKLNGWSFARRVRMGAVERVKDIPFFLLTANNSDENQQKATFHKINGYLLKPPTPDAVKKVLAQI